MMNALSGDLRSVENYSNEANAEDAEECRETQ